MRLSVLAIGLTLAMIGAPHVPVARAAQLAAGAQPEPFEAWPSNLITEARTRGFGDDLLSGPLAALEPLPRVITSDRTQAEVIVTFDRYLASRVTPVMIRRGRELAGEHASVLGRIERTYDVQRHFLLAIWGIETRYGRVTGNTPVFRALATLAWLGLAGALFAASSVGRSGASGERFKLDTA